MSRNRRSVHDFRQTRELGEGPVSSAPWSSGRLIRFNPRSSPVWAVVRWIPTIDECSVIVLTDEGEERTGFPERRERRVGRIRKERGSE